MEPLDISQDGSPVVRCRRWLNARRSSSSIDVGPKGVEPRSEPEASQQRDKVFTFGHTMPAFQMREALLANGIRSLLDCRDPKSVAAGLSRKDLSRLCSETSIQHQLLGSSPWYEGSGDFAALRAAVTFAQAPVVVLCEEADPRNGVRHALGKALLASGLEVLHLTNREGHLVTTRHDQLFMHHGNAIAWPPSIPRLQEVSWPDLDSTLLSDGGRYLLRLPWDTDLIWIPDWLSPHEADELLENIEQHVLFQQPILRFQRGLQTIQARQPRRSAWISDRFNQPQQLAAAQAAGQTFEESVFPAQRLEPWSDSLVNLASKTASAAFNAMLLHTYVNGQHSMGYHSDTDLGLGEKAVIASFSLGATRTFSIKSQNPWNGRRIEFHIRMRHGSFLVMGPGFQGRWLHAVLKEAEVSGCRVNGTLRFYDLPVDAALCACGASQRSQRLE
eukprot:TRINITY_DN31691_c0_g1_i1.p1 TRINITY_DN31691_c0_g1~~TRINITY_DN31691_c0_g1_i1.p1  ORF type:complete len:479 (-),score=75.85 TRINITY_DN31691_c0_g1_i1:246-1580(-)